MQKRVFFGLFLIIMLVGMVSAFSFSDFFGKITGNAVNEQCPEGLVAYYRFNGNAEDSSGNGNNGNIVGNVGSISGKINGAYHFDGNSRITVDLQNFSAQDSSQAFSIAGWVRTTYNYSINHQFANWISKHGGGWETSPFEFTIGKGVNWGENNGPGFNGWRSGRGLYGMSAPDVNMRDGQWHYIVGTYKNGEQRLYHNGILVSNNSESGTLPVTSGTIDIGGSNWHYYHPALNGDLDEVSIWNRVLSASEVADYYNGGSGKEICSAPVVRTCTSSRNCVDNDLFNITNKGSVSYSESTQCSDGIGGAGGGTAAVDSCVSSTILRERICTVENYSNYTDYDCSSLGLGYLCDDGKCVNTSTSLGFSCYDSDNGLNYSVKGYLNISILPETILEDYCLDDVTLLERYCTDNPNMFSSLYNCSDGCLEGICINHTNTIQTCVENWTCGNWSECIAGTRVRNCVDLNGCGINNNKPVMIESCASSGDDSCDGCLFNDECLPIGYRFVNGEVSSYCDLSGINEQKVNTIDLTQSCQNNFECETNQCFEGECVAASGLRASLIKTICSIINFGTNNQGYIDCYNEYILGIPISGQTCTEDNWYSYFEPYVCPESGQQNQLWVKTDDCSLGVVHPSSEVVSCEYHDPCGQMSCGSGEICISGQCVNNPYSGSCGNGQIDVGEECDIGTFNGMSCTDFSNNNGNPFLVGDLFCNNLCKIETSDCYTEDMLNLYLQDFDLVYYPRDPSDPDSPLYLTEANFGVSSILSGGNSITGNVITGYDVSGSNEEDPCASIKGRIGPEKKEIPLPSFGLLGKIGSGSEDAVIAKLVDQATKQAEALLPGMIIDVLDKAEAKCKDNECAIDVNSEGTDAYADVDRKPSTRPKDIAECSKEGEKRFDTIEAEGSGPTRADAIRNLLKDVSSKRAIIVSQAQAYRNAGYCKSGRCSFSLKLEGRNNYLVERGGIWYAGSEVTAVMGCKPIPMPGFFDTITLKGIAEAWSDYQCKDYCGNNKVGPGEECDGENLNGHDCTEFTDSNGNPFTGGDLVCLDGCTFDTSGCEESKTCSASSDYGCSGASPGDSCMDSNGNSGGSCTLHSEGFCSCEGAPYCGNNVCDNGEDYNSCSQDCPQPPNEYCGDGTCNNGEDCYSCSMDCGEAGPYGCGESSSSWLSSYFNYAEQHRWACLWICG